MSRTSRYVDRIGPRTETCGANCRDCGWTLPIGRLSLQYLQDRARAHVLRHNHRVVVHRTAVTVYRPKEQR